MADSEKEKMLAEMDAAARQAEQDLKTVPIEAVTAVANWWKRHYMKAGHKRLAWILLNFIRRGK